MGTEANKALGRRYIELWNTGNLALADEVLALDYVDHTHPELAPGPEAVKHEVTAFLRPTEWLVLASQRRDRSSHSSEKLLYACASGVAA